MRWFTGTMQVLVVRQRPGYSITPSSIMLHDALIEDMNRNGAGLTRRTPPLFLQSEDELNEALDALGISEAARRDSITGMALMVDAWTFRHLCGYADG